MSPGVGAASSGALAYEVPLEFRNAGEDGHDHFAGVSSGVSPGFGNGLKASASAPYTFYYLVSRIDLSQVRAICEAAMREYGVPARIRTDNGAPFAGTGLLGLSKLSLGWMKLGIVHERIQAGRPQQNGRHERMHRTLKEDTTKPPAASLRSPKLCRTAATQ